MWRAPRGTKSREGVSSLTKKQVVRFSVFVLGGCGFFFLPGCANLKPRLAAGDGEALIESAKRHPAAAAEASENLERRAARLTNGAGSEEELVVEIRVFERKGSKRDWGTSLSFSEQTGTETVDGAVLPVIKSQLFEEPFTLRDGETVWISFGAGEKGRTRAFAITVKKAWADRLAESRELTPAANPNYSAERVASSGIHSVPGVRDVALRWKRLANGMNSVLRMIVCVDV